jgi:cytochrome c biogenesis protein CcdA
MDLNISIGLAFLAGLAIPFLIAALSIGWIFGILRRHKKVIHYVEVGMGVVWKK